MEEDCHHNEIQCLEGGPSIPSKSSSPSISSHPGLTSSFYSTFFILPFPYYHHHVRNIKLAQPARNFLVSSSSSYHGYNTQSQVSSFFLSNALQTIYTLSLQQLNFKLLYYFFSRTRRYKCHDSPALLSTSSLLLLLLHTTIL